MAVVAGLRTPFTKQGTALRGLRTVDSLDKGGDDLRELQKQLKTLLGPGTDTKAGR